jgi:hypothetical protein
VLDDAHLIGGMLHFRFALNEARRSHPFFTEGLTREDFQARANAASKGRKSTVSFSREFE